MKNKLIAIICLICLTFSFAGCSLLNLNANRYSEEIIARVGDETITRNEVTSLFNSYYDSYGSQSDVETIFSTAMSQLVNQKILLNEARKIILLSNEDKNEIWQDVFEAIDDQIDEILVDEGLIEESEEEEETEISGYSYEKTTYEKVNYDVDTFDFKKDVTIISVYTRPTEGDRLTGFNKLISNIVETAKSNGRNTDKEIAFDAYVQKIYKSYEDSAILEKFEAYLKTSVVVSDEEVIERYNEILNVNKQKYADSDVFDKDMLNTSLADIVLFAPNSSYFQVQHILLSFNETQTDELKEMLGANSALDYVYREPYVVKRNEFATDLLVTKYRDLATGEVHEDENGFDTYYDVISKQYKAGDEATYLVTVDGNKKVTVDTIKSLVADIMQSATLTNAEKVSYFNQLMFVYGQDPGMQNAEAMSGLWGYILPDPETEAFEDFTFQTEFKDAAKTARESFLTGNTYTGNGYEVAISDNGVHIIIYAGLVGNNGTSGNMFKSESGEFYAVEASANGTAITTDNISTTLKTTFVGGFAGVNGFARQSVYDFIYEQLLQEKIDDVVNEYVAETKADYETQKGMIVKFKETYDEMFSA